VAGRPGTRATITVLAGALILTAFTVWWYWSHRRGFPLFVDESGYTAFAIEHTHALRSDGLIGLLRSIQEHSVHAPLVPVLTVPLELVIGERIGNGFVVVAAFYGLLIVVTYFLGRQLVGPWLAALAAAVVATAPDVLTFARSSFVVIPAAALFTLALYCLLRSDGLLRIGWSVAGGALLGTAMLTRTMVLGLVVGPLAAVLIQAFARGDELRRRLLAFVAAVAATLAVAATWYARNFGDAFDYLTGARFSGTSTRQPAWYLDARDVREIVSSVQLPLALVLTGIAVAGVAAAVRSRRAWRGPREELRHVLRTDAAVLVLVIVEGALALSIADWSQAQWLPLVPAMIALAVLALASLRRTRVRTTLAYAVLALSTFNFVMLSDVWPWLGRPRMVSAGPIGDLAVTDGRQYVDRFFPGRVDSDRPGRFPDSWRRWLPLHRELTAWMARYATERGQRPVVVMGGDESRLLNLNDVLLSDRLNEDEETMLVGRVFIERDTSRHTIRRYFDDPQFGLPNFVITLDVQNRVEPDRRIEGILGDQGFGIVRTVTLPEGKARIWWRSQADVAVSPGA
jgi:Dolichyl-phosphate-mannose-protein mannosyltransferase